MVNKIGRRIYYIEGTGEIIFDTGEWAGTNSRKFTKEEDIEKNPWLSGYESQGLIYKDFYYGYKEEEFIKSNYRYMSLDNHEPIFFYGDPDAEVPPMKPYHMQTLDLVEENRELRSQNLDLWELVLSMNGAE